jgi:hypothetical protein
MLSLNRDDYNMWILMGDFNLIRSPENRNRGGGDNNIMLLFNSIIQHLDLEEIPLKGRAFSWSNMQLDPLLEKLDWIFTSSEWTSTYPDTMAIPLAKLSSDHIPIQVKIGNAITRANIFRFEEFWLDIDGFGELVASNWLNKGLYRNLAQDIVARFKNLRQAIKKWSRNLSQLNKIITNCCYVTAVFDGLEDQRPLSIIENNFRAALKKHTLNLLEAQRKYWRKRANIRWAKLGDENTKFFHAVATRNYRHNYITSLMDEDGRIITKHHQKAAILWKAFKQRLGTTSSTNMMFDLNDLIPHNDLSSMDIPFTNEEIDDVIKHMPNDKVPGPDGFNGRFIKKYWHIIKGQFYVLCRKFYDNEVDI